MVALTVSEAEGAKLSQTLSGNVDTVSAAKMIGCWRALRDPEKDSHSVGENNKTSYVARAHPLQRAIAFSQNIRDSKSFRDEFPLIVSVASKDDSACSVWHVDGKHNALQRRERLSWLEESHEDDRECRVLSNARCLTEGVDVPALDAVIFLDTRSSAIDVIQAVGRVMRKSPDKKYGYIIIPVIVKTEDDVAAALEDDEVFGNVWKVVRALRSHDDRIDQYLISGNVPNLLVVKPPHSGDKKIDKEKPKPSVDQHVAGHTQLDLEKLLNILRTKLAEKVGDRRYLESWAIDVAKITERIKQRILLSIETKQAAKEFNLYHKGLRSIINDHITPDEAIEMLSQHIITGRIFDALFQDAPFTKDNPISGVMNNMVATLRKYGLGSELKDLEGFYKDVESRVSSITSHEGRQNAIRELYDKFFQHAFKKTADRLGMVYTPIEVVDFVLRSADKALRENFGKGLTDRGVQIIDPFVGTGSFITRMMSKDLDLIRREDLERKYKEMIHANEIVLLAYYVAAVNCESTYADITGKFIPFDGLVLTDTFHKKRLDDTWEEGMFSATEKRIEKQRNSDIMVIVGNPPYFMAQKSYSEQNLKLPYPEIDNRIKETYYKKSVSGINNALYDSYIRAIRWASDRLDDAGVIALITNASFIRTSTTSGVRACLAEEFNEIWCFNLRGNALTQGKIRKQEGGNVFGSGSKTPTAITILVKNPKMSGCVIRYKDIGDYLSRTEKLNIVRETKSIAGIDDWQIVLPDKYYDWMNKRDDTFCQYLPMEATSNQPALFSLTSNGIKTNRDVWVYNSSKNLLVKNIKQLIAYISEQDIRRPVIDPSKGKWTGDLEYKLKKRELKFDKSCIRLSLYRPFFKRYLYFSPILNNSIYKIPQLFPKENSENMVIIIPYKGKQFSALISDITPDLHVIEANQCFALYRYENDERRDNITDSAFKQFREFYLNEKIAKLDIFYYVYGMLHHPGYRAKYANNLMRELPRIPMAPDFKVFRDTGKRLANLHLNYEACRRYKLKSLYKPKAFTKLAFGRMKKNGHSIYDTTKILIDRTPFLENIPDMQYRVNGRTPLEWIVDRYKITTDKESGIVNDPCTGTDILAVIERAVYVGVESDRLIKELPAEFVSKNWKPKRTSTNQTLPKEYW